MGAESVTALIPHYGAPETPLPLLEALSSQAGRARAPGRRRRRRLARALPGSRRGRGRPARASTEASGQPSTPAPRWPTGDLLLVLNSDLEIGPTFVADLVAGGAPLAAGRRQPARGRGPTASSSRPDGTSPGSATRSPSGWCRWPDGATPTPCTAPSATTSTRASDEAVVDWVVGAAILVPTADFRAVGRLRRALLHELRGGRPPAPAPRARPAVRRARRADRRPRRRRVERLRATSRVAGAVPSGVRRQVGWAATAAGRAGRGHRRQPGVEHRPPPGRTRRRAAAHRRPGGRLAARGGPRGVRR